MFLVFSLDTSFHVNFSRPQIQTRYIMPRLRFASLLDSEDKVGCRILPPVGFKPWWLSHRQCRPLPVCFFTSDLTNNQKQEPQEFWLWDELACLLSGCLARYHTWVNSLTDLKSECQQNIYFTGRCQPASYLAILNPPYCYNCAAKQAWVLKERLPKSWVLRHEWLTTKG